MKAIGADVRATRKLLRVSRPQLAALAGVSVRPIYLLETGKGAVRVDSLIRILDVLGLKLDVVAKSGG